MMKPVLLLGAGGHACVLADLLHLLRRPILGIVAPQPGTLKNFTTIPYLGSDEIVSQYSPDEVELVNGVGAVSVERNKERYKLFFHFKQQGYIFTTLIHPSAVIASNVFVDEGAQIMAGAILQTNVKIGKNVIVNTGACIDHDSCIQEGAHVAPGAVICGNVMVENHAHIGVGANVIQGIHIGADAMICAGVTIIESVQPSRKIKRIVQNECEK